MNKTTILAVLMTGCALALSSTATAQTQDATRAFVDINGAAQTQTRSITSSTSIPLYGETAVMNGSQNIDSGGLFDISAGYKVLRGFGVAIGVSVFSRAGEGAISASIPSPNVFNRPVTVTSSQTGLEHKETGTHIMAVYFIPVADKIDVSVFAGPSFFKLTQGLISATIPTGTQTINVTTRSESASATGVNVGASINYLFAPRYGVGVFARYAGATADLPGVGDLKVGGTQIGGGFRLRF
jgi:hypothetical protein